MIKLDNVTYSYLEKSRDNIKNLNLTVKKGEFVVLTGKSGCGKTTITRIINGLATKFYDGNLIGKVFINNKDLMDIPLWEIGRNVGAIFQDPNSQFFASLTEDEIAFGCENYGFDRKFMQNRIEDAIEKINGRTLCGKELYVMSSGEKQKIAIASIYAVNPSIYVFDEPSANLDMPSVEKLRELMHLLKDRGHTVVVAEHRLYYLTELADRFIYIQNGRIVKEFTPEKIKNMGKNERCTLGLRAGRLDNLSADEQLLIVQDKTSVQIKELDFSYSKKNIFTKLNLNANCGEIIAVIGHNGVGKSTLAKILCGLLKEKSGNILYNGNPVSKNRRNRFAYFVMQNTDCQLFGQSVREELAINQEENANDQQIESILKQYDLWTVRDNHPTTLSGGQKQRLTLAVSDIINPNVLILDEPTSGLDGENMRRISEHLKKLSKQGKTVFVITHDYEFAVSTCSRAIKIMDGYCYMDFLVKHNSKMLLDCMLDEK